MADGIEQIHVAPLQQEYFQEGEKQIQAPNPACGVHDARVQFVVGQSVHFGNEQLHSAQTQQWQYGDGKHDAEASHPLGQAAPEQDVLGNGFHIGNHGGTGGGKARHGLEESIGKVRQRLSDQIRQAAKQGQGKP